MTFVSFSQNFEDVMLWRALRHIQDGFYVDVGANDPTELSVTRAFYNHGWHGINIEPVNSHYKRLCAERLRDINLNLAAGASEGKVTFYEIPDSALSTTDAVLAHEHEADGLAVKEIIVPMQTLKQILKERAKGIEIHFMNIDVEGSEAEVLRGMDFSRWRPWIILVESTTPTTETPDFQEWENILVANDYKFVYFDALNRFYIAKEHLELAEHFKLPPNLFDRIVPARQVSDQNEIRKLNVELLNRPLQPDDLRLTNEQLRQDITRLEAILQTKNQEISAKEEVIQYFRDSLRYTFTHGPFRHMPILSVIFRFRFWFTPQLGILHQYPPRAASTFLPARYFRVKKLIQPAPKISIVTPTYNYAHFLERTMKSVIQQGYPELEYIVQDGGSTDGTIELVENFKDELKHFESQKDNGQTHAINLGFRHASGEIMAYLNSDDVLLPGTLDYIANYFTTHPEVDVVYGHRLIINENDDIIGDWIMPPHDGQTLRWVDYIPQETMFWRRRIWEKVGGQLDESFHFAMDWDLLLRFQEAGAVFERLPRYLAAFRVHQQQKTSSQIADLGEKEVAQLRMRTLGHSGNRQEITRNISAFLQRSVWYSLMHKIKIRKENFISRLYQENKSAPLYQPESIYFYSLHKAGTGLFTYILRNADELTHVDYQTMVFNNQLPEVISYQKYGHLYGILRITEATEAQTREMKLIKQISSKEFVKDKTIVFLVRDPRDILISFYYSMGSSHVSSPNPDIEKGLQSTRARIQTLDLDEFALSYARRIGRRLEIIFELSKACKHSVILKYEDLLNNFDGFMQDFEKYISIPKKTKRELFKESRPRVKEDISAHKRSGKIGQYKEKLKPETVREINQILKPVLEIFGYADDDVAQTGASLDQLESVYFYSLHKAGTALFTHILRQADKLTHVDYETMLFDNQPPEEISYQKYGHLYGVFRILHENKSTIYIKLTKDISTKEFVKDKTIVFLVRDPRDILISLYYSMQNTHVSSANSDVEKELQFFRGVTQTMSLDEFVIRELSRVRERFEILYELSQNCKHSVILKYEDLLNNFDGFMQDFGKYISIPEKTKQELFEASRPRVKEDLSVHKRSGKIGQYKEKLKPETVDEINQVLKPVLENFGYAANDIKQPGT